MGLELGIRQQEPIGRHQVHVRVLRPAREQGLQHAGHGALAYGDAACETDDERHLAVIAAEEARAHPVQLLCRPHMQVEQARKGQIDLLHLTRGDAVGDAGQLVELVLGEHHGRAVPEPCPLGTGEGLVGRVADLQPSHRGPCRHGLGSLQHGVPLAAFSARPDVPMRASRRASTVASATSRLSSSTRRW